MFGKALRMQCRLLFQRREFWICLSVMVGLALVMPILDSVQIYGAELRRLRSAYYYGLIFHGEKFDYFLFSAPLCICYAFADSFFTDRQQLVLCPVFARMSPKTYLLSKMTVVSASAFFVVFLPLVLNLMVNGILFPIEGAVTYTGFMAYDENYIAFLENILFPSLFLAHPYLYCLLFMGIAGVYYALIASLVYGISLFVKRARIWIVCGFFILSLLLTNVLFRLRTHLPFCLDPNAYIIAFDPSENKQFLWFIGLLFLIGAADFFLLRRYFRKIQKQPLI